MTARDLTAHGWMENTHVPPFWGFCRPCNRYRWFAWFHHPHGLAPTICQTCGVVPRCEAILVEQAVARRQVAEMAETLDPETREVLVLKGML